MANLSEVIWEVGEGNPNMPIGQIQQIDAALAALRALGRKPSTHRKSSNSTGARRKIAAAQTALRANTESRQETFPEIEQNLYKHKATSVRGLATRRLRRNFS